MTSAAVSKTDPNNRVVFVGDSITWGLDGTAVGDSESFNDNWYEGPGYRGYLVSLMLNAGYTFETTGFYDSSNAPASYAADASPPLVPPYDRCNAISGIKTNGMMWQVINNTDWFGADSGRIIIDTTQSYPDNNAPNMVFIMLGTNDLSSFSGASDTAGMDALLNNDYKAILDFYLQHNPDCHFFVAKLTPIDPSNGGWGPLIPTAEAFNDRIQVFADAYGTSSSPNITVVDLYSALNTTTGWVGTGAHLGDGVHPNQDGYEAMAQAWFAALQSVTTSGASGYSAWVGGHGLSGNDALETADPDEDGISNLLEYALNLDPQANARPKGSINSDGLPTLRREGSELVLQYRRDTSKSDLTYVVEATQSLASSTWNLTGIVDSKVGDDGSSEVREARISLGASAVFLRLSVSN